MPRQQVLIRWHYNKDENCNSIKIRSLLTLFSILNDINNSLHLLVGIFLSDPVLRKLNIFLYLPGIKRVISQIEWSVLLESRDTSLLYTPKIAQFILLTIDTFLFFALCAHFIKNNRKPSLYFLFWTATCTDKCNMAEFIQKIFFDVDKSVSFVMHF